MVTSKNNTSPLASLELFDNKYQSSFNQLESYIQLRKENFAIGHFENKANQYVGLSSYDLGEHENWFSAINVIKSTLESSKIIEKQGNVKINFVDLRYTLVPKALFDQNKLESYIKFNHPIGDVSLYSFHADFIENLDLAIIYLIPKSIHSLFENFSFSIKWYHYSKSLLEAASLRDIKEKLFQIHIHLGQFDILLIENNELKFFNSFTYRNTDDFMYYLLYVMDQLNLDRETDSIELVGEFEKNSTLYDILKKYIRHLSIGERTKTVNFSNILSEVPSHYYYNLFNQHLCE